MNSGILTKYSASAGSGKTTELTRRFISKLFLSPFYYRKILAVTFTNKAAAEMKGRILNQLWLIAAGKLKSETERLSLLTGKSEELIKSESGKILVNILHDYSRFSVGTIDSFFQKVLKAFSRESGLQSGYLIELDHSLILSEAVDNLMSELDHDKELLTWVTEFAGTRVEEGKSWNIKEEISELAEELFREKFKLLPLDEKMKLIDRKLMSEYVTRLKKVRSDFSDHLHIASKNIRNLLDRHVVTDDMFYQGKKGIPSFLNKISDRLIDTSDYLNTYILKVLDSPPKFYSKPSPQLVAALENGLGEEITGAIRYFNENQFNVNTADAILSNTYALGILSDLLRNIHEITTSENRFLLSDTGELLYLIIGNDQTPFIYEKIGNYFENYMIDEFQDTSGIQWQNFKPLIVNSMAEGFENLVVGDVKQSIYRWRNSDWRIFNEIIDREIDERRLLTEKLDTNYRSRINIISFNNTLFSTLPEILDKKFQNTGNKFSGLYSDAMQSPGGNKDAGYINIEMIRESPEGTFKNKVLEKLPRIIAGLQDAGYKGSDIGILVRGNYEGSEILKYMLHYRSLPVTQDKPEFRYEFISGDSLILDQNPVISFIVSLLKWLHNPDDDINKALTFRNYLLSMGRNVNEADLLRPDKTENGQCSLFPEGFDDLKREIVQLSLFEAIERIIFFFGLGAYPGNAAYLNAFQDCVMEFMSTHPSEISLFLEWWDTAGKKRSIGLSEQDDSIRVMTIHKSKGLQFKVVMLPFLNWSLTHDKNPTIWVKPDHEPFNTLGLVPVKYRKRLELSYFAQEYDEERFSSVVDNLNLLYVAFTRAEDCLFGFIEIDSGKRSETIGTILEEAFTSPLTITSQKPFMRINDFFNKEKTSLTIGEIPGIGIEKIKSFENEVKEDRYVVNISMNKLRLKLHGDDFLVKLSDDQEKKLNYGKLMHEIFSLISVPEDIHDAVTRFNLMGKIPDNEKEYLEKRIDDLISSPDVAGWFEKDGNVIMEKDILLPSGSTKRPDRIILRNNKTIIVDFKFGEEKPVYINQVNNYRKLLHTMGYVNIEAYLWYVDKNKTVKA